MAARKRKKKGKTKVISSLLSVLKRKKKNKQASWVGPGLMGFLKVLAVICFLGAIAIGLLYLEEDVKKKAEERVRSSETKYYLELADVPTWVSDQLKERVRHVAESSGGDLRSGDSVARSVRRNIEKQIAWLHDVTVRVRQDVLRVEGTWRKPVALIRRDLVEQRYVDSQQVVLEYVPLPHLPIVEAVGISNAIDMPPPGKPWQCDDLAAAITILGQMNRIDKTFASDKPLLFEIDRIDVTNFNGRSDEGEPHIVLYTKDDIQIIWGAEWGKWQQHLESEDKEKLAKLWGYYRQHSTLSVGVKYINLRDPQDKIPLPIDKY